MRIPFGNPTVLSVHPFAPQGFFSGVKMCTFALTLFSRRAFTPGVNSPFRWQLLVVSKPPGSGVFQRHAGLLRADQWRRRGGGLPASALLHVQKKRVPGRRAGEEGTRPSALSLPLAAAFPPRMIPQTASHLRSYCRLSWAEQTAGWLSLASNSCVFV